MSDFGLDLRALGLIRGVFARHPSIVQVRVFGSRAKGHHQPGSDVDLALFGDVDGALARLVAAELDDLPLPYRFDVQVYDTISHPPLREHIDRAGRVLFAALHANVERKSQLRSRAVGAHEGGQESGLGATPLQPSDRSLAILRTPVLRQFELPLD
jgi:predicted nucleotidyltransferase